MGEDGGVNDLFRAAGALRPAYAAVDWAATPLGPVEDWSRALRNAVDLALNTGFPITLLWGPEAVLLYNENYVDILAEKHPWALGRPALEVFPEARDLVEGMFSHVMERDEAVYVEDELVPLVRNGQLSEGYFTFAYSPVHGDDGTVEGVIDIVATTTPQVIAGRRLRLLIRLGTALGDADDADDVLARTLEVLAEDPQDIVGAAIVQDSVTEENLVAGDEGEPVLVVALRGRGVEGGTALRLTLSLLLASDDEEYRDFLRLVVRTIDQALDRVWAIAAERSLSEALQRSLLTQPVSTCRIDVAVRYQPASEVGQIGGDWYDSFRLPDGRLALVVGDVAGHDQDAAAMMAQLRNLTRGVAHSLADSPAAVLAGVDRAIEGLGLGVVATALLVEVDEDSGTARWSNAGHPPPVLLDADGRASLVVATPDVLLGLDPTAERGDHVLELGAGATLVLYTDGLVERRGVPIEDSLRWLAETVEHRQGLTASELCDHLLAQVGGAIEDDVALLVLRVRD